MVTESWLMKGLENWILWERMSTFGTESREAYLIQSKLWNYRHNKMSITWQISNILKKNPSDTYPKEFFSYLAYFPIYTHFIVSIIP